MSREGVAPGAPPGPRDQRESAFSAILRELVARVAGARAAALVDSEGETVDYAGVADPFAIRVTAAHWRIVLDHVRSQPALAGVRVVALRADRKSYLVTALPEGYALVLILARGSSVVGHARALGACRHSLNQEAGWPAETAPWTPVDVRGDRAGRPVFLRIRGAIRPVDVLGAVVGGLARGERAWRVRLMSGQEVLLVRERRGTRGFWYSDQAVS